MAKLLGFRLLIKSHLNKILTLQKRAVRLMNFSYSREHAIPLFISSNIMPLNLMYYKLTATLMFDVYNKSTPRNISNLFTSIQDIHHYNTRLSSSGGFFTNNCRLDHKKNSFSCLGAKIWNNIPESLRRDSKYKYKTKLSKLLFQILQTQDAYVDVDTIMEKMKTMTIKRSSIELL